MGWVNDKDPRHIRNNKLLILVCCAYSTVGITLVFLGVFIKGWGLARDMGIINSCFGILTAIILTIRILRRRIGYKKLKVMIEMLEIEIARNNKAIKNGAVNSIDALREENSKHAIEIARLKEILRTDRYMYI